MISHSRLLLRKPSSHPCFPALQRVLAGNNGMYSYPSIRQKSFLSTDESPSKPSPPQKNILQRWIDSYSLSMQRERSVQADRLFRFAQMRADDPIWYGPGRIGSEFRPRHAILTMHVWFLHKRLISDSTEEHLNSLTIQEELFELFWDDTRKRIREQGLSELTVNKNLKKVQQYTFQHMSHYDLAFSDYESDRDARHEELSRIVWMHLLMRDPVVHADHVQRLVLYMDMQYQNILHRLPESYWRKGRLAWVNIPEFSPMYDNNGKLLPEIAINPKDPSVLPPGWHKVLTNAGTPFYWNPNKGKSQWNRPEVA